MNSLINFIVLDVHSLKNGFGIRMLVAFIVVSVGGFFIMGLDGISLGGAFIIPAIATQTFMVGGDGLDRFYVTLSLSRKDVVVGRYAFVFVATLGIIAAYFFIGVALSFFTDQVTSFSHLPALVSVYFLSSLISSVLLVFLFKLGFKKARPITHFLPILMMLAIMLIERQLGDGLVYNVEQVLEPVSGASVTLATIGASLLIFAASMCISLHLYKKRDL